MVTKDNENLASVLERINLLMQAPPESLDSAETQGSIDDDIPLLLDIYTGNAELLPVVETRQAQIDAIIKEMRPFIQLEIKKALLQETTQLENRLFQTLEENLLATLRQRLQQNTDD